MSYRNEVLADNPVGFWTLDEMSGPSVSDSSGNGHTGSVTGANLDVVGPTANIPGAAYFDGIDDKIVFTGFTSVDTSQPHTYEAWAKAPGGATSQQQLMAQGRHGTTWEPTLGVNASNEFIYEAREVNNTNIIAPSGAFNIGEWHHIVGVYDGVDMHFYLDGVLIDTKTPDGVANETSEALGLGRSRTAFSSDQRFFEGSIAAPAVYDYDLTPVRIQAHYDAAFAEPEEFDPANLQVTIDGTTASLSWNASPLLNS